MLNIVCQLKRARQLKPITYKKVVRNLHIELPAFEVWLWRIQQLAVGFVFVASLHLTQLYM